MSTWSQLEQLLTCAICLDRFRNPKLLPCQHTFCGEPCMDGLVDYARRQIKCPECRAEHRIPYNGVQSFPNNVTLTRFLDLHRSITGEEPEPLPSAMEKCGVCGEKAFCTRCAHCEKKVCEECGVAHLDILRREIVRINQQVRRGLSKLTDQSEQASSRDEKLAQTAAAIRDEITEGVRRFIKDLKDREAKLLAELDQFTQSESKNCSKLNEDLEIELATITANCELAEEHITESDDWTDVELMEYKDIFLKTLDFLRNLDPDTIELGRKIKYVAKVDLDSMRRQAIDFGELKITQPTTFGLSSGQLSPSDSNSNLALPGALMRSQSDHRLAAQFAANQKSQLQRSYLDVTGSGQGRYGDFDNESANRRGDRYGSVRSNEDRRERDPYNYTRGFPRPGDDQYEPSGNFRSRFMRDRLRERTGGTGSDDHSFEDHDSDVGSGSHRVRFQQDDALPKSKLFDTEEMANMRTPLSGLIKLADSPFVMERLHQNQVKAKEKKSEEPKEESKPAPPPSRPATTPAAPKPSRQISEDEVEKQKKQAQAQAAATSTKAKEPTTPTTANPRNSSPNTPANRRVAALQRETGRLSSSRSGSPSEATSGADESDLDANQNHTPSNATSRRRMFSTNHSNSSTTNAQSSTVTPATQPEVANSSRHGSSSSSSALGYRRTNLSRTSTLDDDDDTTDTTFGGSSHMNATSGEPRAVRSYYQSARRHLQAQQRAFNDASALMSSNSASASTTGRIADMTGSSSGGAAAYFRNRLAKSRSSHTISYDDSDDDTTNPLSPPASSGYRSRFKTFDFGGSQTLNENRYGSRRGSRAGYGDDDTSSTYGGAGSVTQYLINKYGTRGNSGNGNSSTAATAGGTSSGSTALKHRSSLLAKSKSSAAIFSRSLSSSDEDNATTPLALSQPPFAYMARRSSRTSGTETGFDSAAVVPSLHSTTSMHSPYSSSSSSILSAAMLRNATDRSVTTATSPSAAGHNTTTTSTALINYPRQALLQKRKLIQKLGARGTSPGCFTWPRGVACDTNGALIVVADSSNHRVQVFDSAGRFQFEFGNYGSGEGQFDCLAGVTVNRIGHFIVSDRYNHRVQVFDGQGRFLRTFGTEGRGDGRFSYPWGIATDALGFIYVCDKENHRIQIFQSDGTFVGKFGSMGSRPGQLEHPHYIAVSNTNRIIVSDTNNHRIQIFDINGRSLSCFGSEGTGDGEFKFPRGVAVDENNFIYVGDSGNNRIQIFNPDGTFLSTFGTWGSGDCEFKGLEGIAVSAQNHILVCDRENHRIQIF